MKLPQLLAACFCLLVVGCGQPSRPVPAPYAPEPALVKSEPEKTANQIQGEVLLDMGFESQEKLQEHFKKHGAEFGAKTSEDYLRRAQVLRDLPPGGDVLQVVRPDHEVSRFQKSTGSFLVFRPEGTIVTFFKPNDGESYFWRQSKR